MKNDPKENEPAEKSPSKETGQLVDIFSRIAATEDPAEGLLGDFRKQYTRLPQDERFLFFNAILREMEVRKSDIDAGLRALIEGKDTDTLVWGTQLAKLRKALESPRVKAFSQFVNLRGGLKFLLDLRVDVLAAQRHGPENLRLLDQDIAQLFNTWFQQGFLFLQQITQDSSFRHIRFLQEHDLVHPMTSIEEMGGRLGADRLCFALFHQSMPDEMVIFIEVALTQGITRSIQDILGKEEAKPSRSAAPDTAIFYSINNTQNGLTGLGFGKLLIFQVVDAIRNNHPHIETFATLSPIPGFWERYLKRILQGDDQPFATKKKDVEALFPEKVRAALRTYHAEQTGTQAADVSTVLLDLLSGTTWIEDAQFAKWLEKPLIELAYAHVGKERGKQGKPLNPVANFHISNGATVSRANVNFGANRSPRGLAESCGLMVNYIYSDTWRHQIRRTVKSLLPWKT
jgi:malonyl-CoA decarboxylase